MIITVKQNIYGNFKGRATGDKGYSNLGDFEFDAKAWMAAKIKANPGAKIHPDSVIQLADIQKFL